MWFAVRLKKIKRLPDQTRSRNGIREPTPTRKQSVRSEDFSGEIWTKIDEADQNREKQEWKNEKPKLDNARRLKRIYFIDSGDQDYKEILKNARRKIGKTHGTSYTLQEDGSYQHHESGCEARNCISKDSKDD